MNETKLKRFEDENSEKLPFQELKGEELKTFIKVINDTTKFDGSSCADFYKHINTIMQNDIECDDIDDPDLFVKICKVLNLGVSLDNIDSYVIGYYPNEVDKFQIQTLKKWWEYIWYSMGDDAIIVAIPNKDLMILFTHHGDVKYQNFP